ncbi:LysM domain [Dillenia turbinata]|uniref:LysM domain n=1 Tax=Dillenia turbinata TaxID=194707 RepID=A0AAN8V1I7_9MAGN
MSNERDGDGSGAKQNSTIAKSAGLIVFSGIAISILKSLNPYNRNKNQTPEASSVSVPVTDQSLPTPPPPPPPPLKLITHTPEEATPFPSKEPTPCGSRQTPESSKQRIVNIVKGDTLWGLSKKYGVSIEAIKEANGLTGDTIYAGKKLVIPDIV